MIAKPSMMYPRFYLKDQNLSFYPFFWYELNNTHVWAGLGRIVFTTEPPSKYDPRDPLIRRALRKIGL